LDAPWRFRARYQLAQIDLIEARKDLAASREKGIDEAQRVQLELSASLKFDDANKLLQENLNELRQVVNPEPAVQEMTVYGLADIAYEREEYQTAEPRLKGALQEYPQSTHAVRAHYRLALCLWKAATEEFKNMTTKAPSDPTRERTQKQYLDFIDAAIEQYAAVEAALVQRPALSGDEVEMLKRSSFGLAELKYFAGRYAEAADAYDALSRRYDSKVEGLHAIHQLWNCQKNCLNQPEKAIQTIERLRAAIDKISASDFNGASEMHNQDYWTRKLVEMAKQN
jgi:TolA-binding protein